MMIPFLYHCKYNTLLIHASKCSSCDILYECCVILANTSNFIDNNFRFFSLYYLATFKGCVGIDFTHCVWMDGQLGGRVSGKSLSGLYLRKPEVDDFDTL